MSMSAFRRREAQLPPAAIAVGGAVRRGGEIVRRGAKRRVDLVLQRRFKIGQIDQQLAVEQRLLHADVPAFGFFRHKVRIADERSGIDPNCSKKVGAVTPVPNDACGRVPCPHNRAMRPRCRCPHPGSRHCRHGAPWRRDRAGSRSPPGIARRRHSACVSSRR